MRFATPRQYDWDEWGESSALIVSMGLALAIAGIVQTLAAPATKPLVALELFLSLLVPTGLATGGYWLVSQNISRDVRRRVAIWMSAGIVGACALGGWLWLYVALEGGTIHGPLSIVTTLATVGGAGGFVAAVRLAPKIESPSSVTEQPATPETGAAAASSSDSRREPTPPRSTGPAIGASEPPQSTTPSTPATSPPPESATPSRPATPAEPAESVSAPTARSSLEPRVDTVAAAPPTAEAVLEILRDTRARTTLAVLYHERGGNPQSVDELARAVADHTDDCVEDTTTALRQSTLPQLRTARAIDWDPATDRITAPEHAVFEEGVREASALLESFAPGTR
ncbi:hypothetical protein [Natronorubrum halophilum]|uniref:hypothetical protein n=1 Tax=Natronorubrum halophilum TaxID=1702106 RepID=UPI0010C2407E|nr:hypothetical protein [Natronorubrum halophilum]